MTLILPNKMFKMDHILKENLPNFNENAAMKLDMGELRLYVPRDSSQTYVHRGTKLDRNVHNMATDKCTVTQYAIAILVTCITFQQTLYSRPNYLSWVTTILHQQFSSSYSTGFTVQ